MQDTSFKNDTNSLDKLDRFVIVNQRQKEYIELLKQGKEEELSEEDKLWKTVPDTGGGLFSTASDLVKFCSMLEQEGYYGDHRVIGR